MQNIKTIDSLFYKQVGEKIRKIREHRGITLKELAQETGYSRVLIDYWELGYSKIKPHQFDRICKALKVPNKITLEIKIGE